MYAARQNKEKTSRCISCKNKLLRRKNTLENSSNFGNNFNNTFLLKRKGKEKRSKGDENRLKEYSNTQEKIQNYMIDIWLKGTTDEDDLKKANYVYKYRKEEGGWCDGWAYLLAYKPETLLEIWEKVDKAIENKYVLNSTDKYNVKECVRRASTYHILNGEPDDQQKADYKDALYNFESKGRETWHHDEDNELEIYEIIEEIKKLKDGHTLRLTSPVHDCAIYKRQRNVYIVAETELSGIQLCDGIEEIRMILENWKSNGKEDENSEFVYFTQFMVIP